MPAEDNDADDVDVRNIPSAEDPRGLLTTEERLGTAYAILRQHVTNDLTRKHGDECDICAGRAALFPLFAPAPEPVEEPPTVSASVPVVTRCPRCNSVRPLTYVVTRETDVGAPRPFAVGDAICQPCGHRLSTLSRFGAEPINSLTCAWCERVSLRRPRLPVTHRITRSDNRPSMIGAFICATDAAALNESSVYATVPLVREVSHHDCGRCTRVHERRRPATHRIIDVDGSVRPEHIRRLGEYLCANCVTVTAMRQPRWAITPLPAALASERTPVYNGRGCGDGTHTWFVTRGEFDQYEVGYGWCNACVRVIINSQRSASDLWAGMEFAAIPETNPCTGRYVEGRLDHTNDCATHGVFVS